MNPPQQPSLFLTLLPKEIRLQIYALILGTNNTIHILPSSNQFIYTLCCYPNSDNDVYLRSKEDDVEILPAWDEVYFAPNDKLWIRTYERCHERCLRIMKSIYWRSYDPNLYIEEEEEREWENRSGDKKIEDARSLIKTFGKFSKERLKREIHPENFIWGLRDLSLVCKMIYFETREVVFRENWISVMGDFRGVRMIFDRFEDWQLNAMRRLHLKTTFDVERGFDFRPSEMVRLVHLLPGLVELGLDISATKEDVAMAFQLELEQHHIKERIVARARVMVGCDDVSEWILRSWRREQARRIERLLTGVGHEDGESGDGEAVGVVNAERRLEMLKIPNVGPEGERERMIHVLREQRVMWV